MTTPGHLLTCDAVDSTNPRCVCDHVWYCHNEQGHCDHCDCRGFEPAERRRNFHLPPD